MSYKESLTAAMTELGRDPLVRFLGYGVARGKAMGTLFGVPQESLIETPVAENLMAGLACGMALTGLRPVLYYERFDFVLNAADAIVNHIDAMRTISRGEFSPGVIIRITVGNRTKPLFTGPTHVQDFSEAFRSMLRMPVVKLLDAESIADVYRDAHDAQTRGESTMVVELKDKL